MPCHASTDVSCLPFSLSAALRLQLHIGNMRLQARLAERKKYGATSRHFTHERTLAANHAPGDNYAALPCQRLAWSVMLLLNNKCIKNSDYDSGILEKPLAPRILESSNPILQLNWRKT